MYSPDNTTSPAFPSAGAPIEPPTHNDVPKHNFFGRAFFRPSTSPAHAPGIGGNNKAHRAPHLSGSQLPASNSPGKPDGHSSTATAPSEGSPTPTGSCGAGPSTSAQSTGQLAQYHEPPGVDHCQKNQEEERKMKEKKMKEEQKKVKKGQKFCKCKGNL